jgi:hypothetical protein
MFAFKATSSLGTAFKVTSAFDANTEKKRQRN